MHAIPQGGALLFFGIDTALEQNGPERENALKILTKKRLFIAKHYDFLIVDLAALILGYWLSLAFRRSLDITLRNQNLLWTYGIAALLRLGHDAICRAQRKKDAKLCREAYGDADLFEAVRNMARARRKGSEDPVVPAALIGHLVENTGSDLDPRELCRQYLETAMEQKDEMIRENNEA